VLRTTHLLFDPAPSELTPRRALYRLPLRPNARVELAVTVSAVVAPGAVPASIGRGEVISRRRQRRDRTTAGLAQIRTDHQYANEWIARSRSDLHMLTTETPLGSIAYAGIPWYVTPFGRDSIIVALQLLPFEPELARGTLRFLAAHQGRDVDDFTDREPGKILHELRGGEMAACREIPFIPYYGSVDATPLFAILLAEYLKWTNDRSLAIELWPAVELALDWITGPGRLGDEDYLRYVCRSSRGLGNQGWKDSFDAVMHADGRLAESPIALVEVQAYQYGALVAAASVAELLDQRDRAERWHAMARRLQERFERDFWMEADGHYALALDGEGRPCQVISSNPGHCLWMGIADGARAERVGKRLVAEDLFSGWGIRTLSTRERRYNPMSYHNGSVWPHDTAIGALGLRRHGATEAFLAVCTALFEAALHCPDLRVPELFCGFSRQAGFGPTRYPVACSPQAWAAGVVFHLIQGMLGLSPDAGANRLDLVDPVLPSWLTWIELRGLRLGDSSIDLLVSRGRHGAAVEVLARRGTAEIIVRS
jgi:glycogen debranching enzyme